MIFLLIIPAVFLLDTYIKKKIESAPKGTLPTKKLGGRITFCRSHNYGMMMNTLDQKPELVKRLTAGSYLALSLWYLIYCLRSDSRLLKLGGAMMLGGAASNTCDHLTRGYVVDYLQFPVKPIQKIAFNLSDFFIFIGSAILFLRALFAKE